MFLVFIAGAPAPAGVALRSDRGAEVAASGDGAGRLELPAGTHTLTLVLPPGTVPNQSEQKLIPAGKVVVPAGGSTQLLVNLDEKGEPTSIDVEGETAEPTEAEAAAEATEQAVVVQGTIRGRVISDDKKEPIEGVLVLVPGVETETRTDADGRFELKVPSGTQSVSAIHTKFSTQTQGGVEVPPEGVVEINISLTPAATQLDDVVVTAPHIKGGVASELSKRRESVAVQDSLGSADIAKTGDGSASSASKRIVGASIVGGQFLFVRGLGGRYSNVRLNGVPLPSTDPDLPGFQLDLFPTSLLASLTIAKTFTPDIPGDFAGGSMNIETKAFPEEFTLTLGVSTSYNTETTGRDILGSQGGETDWLGTDDGGRALPDEVPEEKLVKCRTRAGQDPPEGCLTPEEIVELSQAFPNTWKLVKQTAYPNLGVSASVGNTFDLGGAGKLGFLLTGGYKYGFESYVEKVTKVTLQGTGDEAEVTAVDTLNNRVGEQEALMGALGTIGYSPVENHDISVVSLITRNGVDKTTQLSGRSEEESTYIERTNFGFVQRELFFNQLLGNHRDLGDMLTIAWQLNTATIGRDQPDTRSVLYAEGQSGLAYRPDVSAPGERLYSELEQTDYGGGLDLTLEPIEKLIGKAGYMGRTADRRFAARRFRPVAGTSPEAIETRTLPPEEFFDPDNAGTGWELSEQTRETDGFTAEQQLHAVYGMVQLPVLDWLLATGGLRLERFEHSIEAFTPYRVTAASEMAEEVEMDAEEDQRLRGSDLYTDYLPAGGLIFNLSESMGIRAAYGGTVARPQIKELAPFTTDDYVRRRSIKGNPNLERTYIHNLDLRWEMFPTPTQVFAVSVFYKIFQDPIESVILDTNGNITFENIAGADNYGVELEARIGLDVITDTLTDFSVLSNLALIQSQVRLTDEQKRSATSQERPLAGQSPYVANLGLGWEPEWVGLSAFCFYNVFGRRISDVGRQGMPDEYEEAFHSIEANVNYEFFDHFNVSVSGSNLLFAEERYTQGDVTTVRVDKGATFGLSLGYEY